MRILVAGVARAVAEVAVSHPQLFNTKQDNAPTIV